MISLLSKKDHPRNIYIMKTNKSINQYFSLWGPGCYTFTHHCSFIKYQYKVHHHVFSPSLTGVCQYPSPSLQIKSWSSSASISTIRRSRITSNCHPTIYSPFSGSVVLSPGYRLESPKDCEDAPWWVWPVPLLARAHAWVSGWASGGARIDVHKKPHISVSLPLFLPPFPLSKNKSMKYFF